MAISLDQFTQQLAASGLMSTEDVQAALSGAGAEQPQDGEQLARLLIKHKKLTAFQAQQIYAGKGKSLVLGNYVIVDKLGQGGMGMVLKAEHRRMKRVVALKILSPAVTKNPDMARRFQREVEAAAKLEHPNIVTAYDADETNGTHFLVMQYVEGTDLAALVKQQGPLSIERAVPCVLQAARGLEYAHQRGVVHRDIKPANLLLDRKGTVKILDMGLARLDAAGGEQDQLTGTGQIMGTVDYMAPEQAMDTKTADARADIYSLGVTLWYLLSGRAVYEGDTVVKKLMAHQTAAIPSLSSVCAQATPQLAAIFAKMIAKTPDARYQSMTEVIAELERSAGGGGSTPAVAAPIEDSRLSAFLSGADSATGSPVATKATAKKKAPAAAAAAEQTQLSHSAQSDTDPQTQRSLPALPAKTVLPAKARRGRKSGKASGLGRNAWIGIGGGTVLLVAAVVFFLSKGADPAPVEKQEIAVGNGGPSAAPARVKRLAKAEPNTLSAQEAAAGWKLLFDGKTTAGWRNYKQPTIGPAWKTENGALTRTAAAGDIVTAEQYDAFELSLEYKISKGGNSGVIYHVVEDGNQPWMSGPEVQILDNKDGIDPQKAGWLYQLYSTDKDATKPAGEWNELRIVITPEKCEHFMNGERYVEYVIGSDDWNQRVAGCKFGSMPGYGKSPRGYICLQDHGNDVAFRNIKIRPLPLSSSPPQGPPQTAAAESPAAGLVIAGGAGPGKGKHVVLISGDEEYRSEEALPQLAKILARHHGCTCTVLFAIDPADGTINPAQVGNIPGLEALKTADLMVLFTRYRNLPDEQMRHIDDYVKAGKPVIGLRTATHAFDVSPGSAFAKYTWNGPEGGFGLKILGATWNSHHGKHGTQSTRGILAPGQSEHPILRGIQDGDIWGPTDVYGLALPLPGDSRQLVLGQVLAGMSAQDAPVEGKQNDPLMPVAWIKSYAAEGGKAGRVFTTTMGSSQDLQSEGFRRLVVNAAYWGLALEDKIPEKSNVDVVGKYEPTRFSFGGFVKGRKPVDYAAD